MDIENGSEQVRLSDFKAEGLIEWMFPVLGQVSGTLQTMNTTFEKVNELIDTTSIAFTTTAQVWTKFTLVMKITTFVAQARNTASKMDALSIAALLWQFYELLHGVISYTGIDPTFIFGLGEEYLDIQEFKAEGDIVTALGIAAAVSTLLPRSVAESLRLFSTTTRYRLLEDMAWIDDAITLVISIPSFIISFVSNKLKLLQMVLPDTLFAYINKFVELLDSIDAHYNVLLDWLPTSGTTKLIHKMQDLMTRYDQNKRELYQDKCFDEIKAVYAEMESYKLKIERVQSRASDGFRNTANRFRDFYKMANAMRQTIRQEPVMFIITGDPGIGKSYYLSQVIKLLEQKNTIYHYTPKPGEKDFHDHYSGQSIWMHEDIGQTGMVDFSRYIYYVSCNPTMLDAAAVENKSSIFFNSTVIVGTSNVDIVGGGIKVERDCGFADADAVRRRIKVVDTRGVEREGNEFKGAGKLFTYQLAQGVNLPGRYVPELDERGQQITIDLNNPVSFINLLSKYERRSKDQYKRKLEQIASIPLVEVPEFGAEGFEVRYSADDDSVTIASAVFDNPANGSDVRNGKIKIDMVNLGLGRYVVEPRYNIRSTIEQICEGKGVKFEPTKIYVDGISLLQCGLLLWGDLKYTGLDSHVISLAQSDFWSKLKNHYDVCKASMLDGMSTLLSKFSDSWSKCNVTVFNDIINYLKGIGSKYNLSLLNNIRKILPAVAVLSAITAGIYSYNSTSDDVVSAAKSVMVWPKYQERVRLGVLVAQGNEAARLPYNGNIDDKPEFMALRRNVLKVRVCSGARVSTAMAVLLDSEHFMLPMHLTIDENNEPVSEIFVHMYDNAEREVIAELAILKYSNTYEDISICKFKHPNVPRFTSIVSRFKNVPTTNQLYLVNTYGVIPLGIATISKTVGGYFSFRNDITKIPSDAVQYDAHASGLCGSLVVFDNGAIYGWHVACNTRTGLGYGRPIRKNIRDMIQDFKLSSTIPRKETSITGAISLDADRFYNVATNTKYVPSDLHPIAAQYGLVGEDGIIERAPAVCKGSIEINGVSKSIFDNAQTKNLTPGSPVNTKALAFAKLYMRKLLAKVTNGRVRNLTMFETLNGTSGIESIRGEYQYEYKDTMVAVPKTPARRASKNYIKAVDLTSAAGIPFDCKNGNLLKLGEQSEISERLLSEFMRVEEAALRGVKLIDGATFKDQLKDELRPHAKCNKPRLFAAGPLHYTLLLRKYFGELCSLFMDHRLSSGVMIGLNATSNEWDEFTRKLIRKPNLFDGDYKSWDGAMVKSFQLVLHEELANLKDDRVVAETLLSYLSETVRAGGNSKYMTTHSVPSGHGLTALYNSLINKMYVAYAFYALGYSGGSIDRFLEYFMLNVDSYVYGDDIIVAVTHEVSSWFNAISYTTIMDGIGLGFTNASKTAPTDPFVPLNELSFLKRKFYFHPELCKVTGPLELSVLRSTLCWISDPSRSEELLDQKMDNVQRELFLHPPVIYEYWWNKMKMAYKEVIELDYPEKSKDALMGLYDEGILSMLAEGCSFVRKRKQNRILRHKLCVRPNC